jgi:CheY-like chemotaxis protein
MARKPPEAAATAPELPPDALTTFTNLLFAHVAAEDIASYDTADLTRFARGAYEHLAVPRLPRATRVRLRDDAVERAGVRRELTIIEVVNDNMPFLLDSTLAELTDQGDLSHAFAEAMKMWKISKTALSPVTHMNNVMSNFVMADWHDVRAAHVSKSLRILLAEDNEVNREVAVARLRRAGHHVSATVDGAAALELWRTKDFDAVLLDIQMPIMDGIAFTPSCRITDGLLIASLATPKNPSASRTFLFAACCSGVYQPSTISRPSLGRKPMSSRAFPARPIVSKSATPTGNSRAPIDPDTPETAASCANRSSGFVAFGCSCF